MDGLYGIVGMSTGLTRDSGPILVSSLYDGGVISEPVFGWYLTGLQHESYLDIGILTDDSIRKGEKLVWLPVVYDDFWWTNFITGIKIDGDAYSLPKAYAMTDTGTSCIYAPTSVYSRLIDHISKSITTTIDPDYGFVTFDCEEKKYLPNVEFLFGGYWMEMLPEDYIYVDDWDSNCSFCILDNGDETWLLGDSFLRGFYSTHDHLEKRFGFAPHSLSKKKSPYRGEQPADELPVVMAEWEQIILWVVGILVLAAIGVAVYFLVPKPAAGAEVQRVSVYSSEGSEVEIASLLQELQNAELLKGKLKIDV